MKGHPFLDSFIKDAYHMLWTWLILAIQLYILQMATIGGPAGGNGGDGGHIWAVVDPGLNSLSSFRKQLHFRGSQGSGGGGSGKHGACGADIEIRVPRGTIVREKDAAEGAPALAELLKEGQNLVHFFIYGGDCSCLSLVVHGSETTRNVQLACQRLLR